MKRRILLGLFASTAVLGLPATPEKTPGAQGAVAAKKKGGSSMTTIVSLIAILGAGAWFFIGDAARVVEPFTGEGIYYAMRSGELAANAIAKITRGEDRQTTLGEFVRACAEMYRGRLWINRLARAAVVSPRLGSFSVHAARIYPGLLKLLTAKIVNGL